MNRLARPGAAIALAGWLLAACATDEGADDRAAAGDGPRGEVVVFAAASLTDVFGALADDVEARNPDLQVVLHLAGSRTLAEQIEQGAPADVYASADAAVMDEIVAGGHAAADPVVMASTTLAIAVEPGNPRGIEGLADLADPELVVVLPTRQAAAGAYAQAALDAAGVQVDPASLERDVRAAMAKVALGEADAAIVYTTDVTAADGRVDGLAVEGDVLARFPIVTLSEAPNPDAAATFVEHVLSDEGRRAFADHGFAGP